MNRELVRAAQLNYFCTDVRINFDKNSCETLNGGTGPRNYVERTCVKRVPTSSRKPDEKTRSRIFRKSINKHHYLCRYKVEAYGTGVKKTYNIPAQCLLVVDNKKNCTHVGTV